MSRVEAVERRRDDRPGCCAMCRIAWCPCVIASHRESSEVEAAEPVPAVHLVATERTMPAALKADDLLDSLVPGREHELRRAA